jgi:hypothetical protein
LNESRTPERGLIRYWITFDDGPRALLPGITLDGNGFKPDSCGVTAFDLEDALRIVAADLFGGGHLPAIKDIVEDVDVSSLEVVLRGRYYAPPVWRGMWFPATSTAGPAVDEDRLRALGSSDVANR